MEAIPRSSKQSGLGEEPGIISLGEAIGIEHFISAGSTGYFWERAVDRRMSPDAPLECQP